MTDNSLTHSSFILDKEWISFEKKMRLPVLVRLIKFNIESYKSNHYMAFGINMPRKLERAVSKRQAEFLAGRIAAQDALSALNINSFEVETGSLRQPIWPDNVTGSISHTSDVAVAVTLKKPKCFGIGIDVEAVISMKTNKDISNTIINSQERALLRSYQGTHTSEQISTIVFSSKESFFKCVSPLINRYLEFDAVNVTGFCPGESKLELTVTEDLSSELTQGMTFSSHFTFINRQLLMTVVTL